MLRICNHCGHLNTHSATLPHVCAGCGKITEVNGRVYPPPGSRVRTTSPSGDASSGCTRTVTKPPEDEK